MPQRTPVLNHRHFEYPGAPLPIGSQFYIPRSPIEEQAFEQLQRPGSLTRIRAARKMGKTSLLFRILQQAHSLKYAVVVIDFHQAEASILSDFETLLHWFCNEISRQLGLTTQIGDIWDANAGSKINCTLYLQKYVLRIFDSPTVLFLRHIDAIFPYADVTQELFPLLRGWFEDARWLDEWQKLRLVMTHATDIYVPLQLHQSPFNVGLSLKLPEFTPHQVQDLAQQFELSWFKNHHADALRAIVGGHPYLVAIAMHHLAQKNLSFEELLAEASYPQGIYGDHLRGYWSMIKTNPTLLATLQQLVHTVNGFTLESTLAYQLESSGLVSLQGERAVISCDLYRQYFSHQLAVAPLLETADPDPTDDTVQTLHYRLQTANQETQDLQALVNIDNVTQFLKRQAFRNQLTERWKVAIIDQTPLALMICSIDYLSVYIEAYGHDQGDSCIHQIASLIRDNACQPLDHFSRYGLDEMVILLTDVTADEAHNIGEQIRSQVEALELHHAPQYLGLPLPVVTVSLGIAFGIPQSHSEANDFLAIADRALTTAIRKGHNQINLITQPIE